MNVEYFVYPLTIEEADPAARNRAITPAPFTYTSTVDEPLISAVPMNTAVVPQAAPAIPEAGLSTTLLDQEVSGHLRDRWNEIQGRFVDDPRFAVQQADMLVSDVAENIARMFASERSSLESQWTQGLDVSTEDLRKTLQHYRSFFNRLVA